MDLEDSVRRLVALGREQEGVLTLGQMRGLLPVEELDVGTVARVVARLEAEGVTVELDEDLTGRRRPDFPEEADEPAPLRIEDRPGPAAAPAPVMPAEGGGTEVRAGASSPDGLSGSGAVAAGGRWAWVGVACVAAVAVAGWLLWG
ncbi:MAG TPA: hypothetical protein VED40_16800 [Azospirillaceae bacterium]|nr:hypothetical protein [Azospirillaceae bacterium]